MVTCSPLFSLIDSIKYCQSPQSLFFLAKILLLIRISYLIHIFIAEDLHQIMADQKHSEDQHQTKDLLNNSIPDLNPNLNKFESNLSLSSQYNSNLKPSTCLVTLQLQPLQAQPSTVLWRRQTSVGKASNSSSRFLTSLTVVISSPAKRLIISVNQSEVGQSLWTLTKRLWPWWTYWDKGLKDTCGPEAALTITQELSLGLLVLVKATSKAKDFGLIREGTLVAK